MNVRARTERRVIETVGPFAQKSKVSISISRVHSFILIGRKQEVEYIVCLGLKFTHRKSSIPKPLVPKRLRTFIGPCS